MASPPVAFNRLKQIANDACQNAIGSAEYYDHSKTEEWNSTIINSILKAVIAESTTGGASRLQLNKPKGTAAQDEEPQVTTSAEEPKSTDNKPHVGRRGMHSATGAFWDEKRDGMWSFKYDGGEGKGMDVVVMLIWIGI
ncbi:unnamed protein product [Parascedosporium putredinis]|uniref:Dynein light chain n=1 Tax=Parascedosporium putredinis TaxID=1442378 RepID=A0A9P1GXQ7_9PEZI|nr:unnamed protein product [Parascedosporium putredinis]CAI7989970.1 unnamed protein product [Parascedosporium putredinis]